MFLLHCDGQGRLSVNDTIALKTSRFKTMEQVVAAYQGREEECAWTTVEAASSYYFYDFIWPEMVEAVNVPVGEAKERLTIHKPAHAVSRR